MLKFATFSAGLRQWCILKASEVEVRRCGKFDDKRKIKTISLKLPSPANSGTLVKLPSIDSPCRVRPDV